MKYPGAITDISGILVGHAQDENAKTGCTAVLCEGSCVAGIDVRGGSPGTRETDLLRPGMMIHKIHGIALCGGSAFGLDAAAGFMQYLEERGIGFDTGVAKVPIICGAVIFDLAVGKSDVRPDKAMGYAACANAKSDARSGAIGAGTGATVGKTLGMEYAMAGGVGTASLALPGGVIVAALVVVNALGAVYDYATGDILAGPRKDGVILDPLKLLLDGGGAQAAPGANTTIGVVATNVKLDKAMANRLASTAHNGLAMSIRPAHTMFDGDTLFAVSTCEVEGDINTVFAAAPVAVARAVANAVYRD